MAESVGTAKNRKARTRSHSIGSGPELPVYFLGFGWVAMIFAEILA